MVLLYDRTLPSIHREYFTSIKATEGDSEYSSLMSVQSTEPLTVLKLRGTEEIYFLNAASSNRQQTGEAAVRSIILNIFCIYIELTNA